MGCGGIFPRASFTRGEQGSTGRSNGSACINKVIRGHPPPGLLTGDAIDFPGPQTQAPHPSCRSVTAFIFENSGTAVELATPERKLIQSLLVREFAITYLTHSLIPPIGQVRSILGLQLRVAHNNIAEALARHSVSPLLTYSSSRLRTIVNMPLTGQEVAKHSTQEDCWVVVHGKAYDVTEFLPEHPGGMKIILKYAVSSTRPSLPLRGQAADSWILG